MIVQPTVNTVHDRFMTTSIPERLDGAARRAWEGELKATPGLRGRSMLVLLTLLDVAYGKCWAYPSDAYIAKKARVSEATAERAVRDLIGLGLIRVVKVDGRRWIVFPGHPAAASFLAGLGVVEPQVEAAEPQVEAAEPQVEARSIELNLGAEETTKTVVDVPPLPPIEDPGAPPAWDDAIKAVGKLVERPAGAVRRIMQDLPGIAPEDVQAACTEAHAKGKGWGYARGIMANWMEEGKAIPPAPAPKPERAYYRARVVTEADREAAREFGVQLKAILARSHPNSTSPP
jgi:Helix-turn-helix domain